MNAIKKTIKYLAVAIGAAFGVVTTAKATGDIYSIYPYNEKGDISDPLKYSISDPMKAGVECRFLIRLAPRGDSEDYMWQAYWSGLMDENVAKAVMPFQIGIIVSGELRWADFKGYSCLDSYFTDIYFSYTTQPGDVAFPILLAAKSGEPAVYEDTYNNEYLLHNLNYGPGAWQVRCKNADEPTWAFTTAKNLNPGDGITANKDYTLRGLNFYVQTIDFDDEWEEDPTNDSEGIVLTGQNIKVTTTTDGDGKGIVVENL